jgi:signal peptidase I
MTVLRPIQMNRRIPSLYRISCSMIAGVLLFGCSALSRRTVVFQGTSMLPTIRDGQRLDIEKLDAELTAKLVRGDIIVFKFPDDPSKGYIKRLIGLPGDTVEVRANEVWVNGSKLDEPYIDPRLNLSQRSWRPVVVPARSYYVLGDNRDNSSDSRIWGFVPEHLLISKVINR